jgi:hypothetical protein
MFVVNVTTSGLSLLHHIIRCFLQIISPSNGRKRVDESRRRIEGVHPTQLRGRVIPKSQIFSYKYLVFIIICMFNTRETCGDSCENLRPLNNVSYPPQPVLYYRRMAIQTFHIINSKFIDILRKLSLLPSFHTYEQHY